MKTPLISLIAALVLLTGCASKFQMLEIDGATGRFIDKAPITQEEIKVNKPFAGIKEIPFIYVHSASDVRDEQLLTAFTQDSLMKLDFPRTIKEQELTQLVIKGGLSSEIQNLYHPIALHRLSKTIGPFLILQTSITYVSEARFRMDAVIFDPVSAEVIFSATRQKVVWASIEDEIFFPMMNVLKDWHKKSELLPTPKALPPAGRGV